MIYEVKDTKSVEPLFKDWPEAVIWSCLQGIMGKLYTPDLEHPVSVMAILGDFCYFAGEPDRELVLFKPEWTDQDFIIMVPQDEDWAELIESCYGSKATKVLRYAIKKERGIFDEELLKKAVSTLPDEYDLQLIDEKLFYECKNTDWCKDWVFHYEDYAMFQKYGLGVVVLKDGEPVSGASSYCGFQDGIEIEIITKEEYRRKGLAYVCGAGVILECLKRGWYPSWDAQNLWSKALAQKLGYHYSHDYVSYEIRGY